MKTIQLTIRGRVQRVGFRYHTFRVASELGLKGIVMNLPDGSVFIEAEGEEVELEKFTAWCREGPRFAIVDSVETQAIPGRGFTEFLIV